MSESASTRMDDRATKETLDALAQRAYESQYRDQQRMVAMAIRLILFAVVPFTLFVVWIATVGSQRHVLEVHDGDSGFRIISRRSPFEISVASEEFAKPIPGGILAHTNDRVAGTSIQPRSYEWGSFVDTEQVVTSPKESNALDFWINDVHFETENGEVISGERRWLMKPGQLITIEVDRLPPTLPPSATPTPTVKTRVQ